MTATASIWAFDLGKGSSGFAVLINSQLPVASKPREDGSTFNFQVLK